MESSQSQMRFQTSDLDLTSIPLEKYSSAVSLEGSRNHRWVHDVRKELTLTFKTLDIPVAANQYEKRLIMAITAGRESLEQVDADKLVKLVREHDERVYRGMISSGIESPVQVVLKLPCIAMRYPGTPPIVRRFQIKFRDEKHYLQAFNVLKHMGFPLKESIVGSKTDIRAQSREMTQTPSLVPPSSPCLPPWPSNSHQSSEGFSPELGMAERYPLYSTLSIPDRSDSTSASTTRPPSVFSQDFDRGRSSSAMDSSNDRPSSADFKFQPPPPRPFSSVPSMGCMTSIYDSQVESKQRTISPVETYSINKTAEVSQPPRNGIRDLPNFSEKIQDVSQSTSDVSFKLSHEISQPARADVPTSQYFDGTKLRRSATVQSTENPTLYNVEALQLGRHNSLRYDAMRPMSAPITSDALETSPWIPPRRELPFPKPKEPKKVAEPIPKSQETVESTISEPSATAVPGKETKTPPAPAPKRGGKRVAQRKAAPPAISEIPNLSEGTPRRNPGSLSITPERETAPLVAKSAAIARPSIAPGLQSKATVSRKRPAETKLKAAPVKIVKMVDSSTQTQTGSGRDHTVLIPWTTTPVIEHVAATVPVGIRPPTPPENFMSDLEYVVEKHGKRTKPVELWETSGWEKATEKERHVITENWICKQLEDPKFQELCKTVENVWQRIGLES